MSILTNANSAAAALLAVRYLLFISLAIASLQNIANAGLYSRSGLLNWPFLRYAYQVKIFETRAFDKLFGLPGFLTLNLARILLVAAAGAGAIVGAGAATAAQAAANQAKPWILAALFLIQLALYIRSFPTMSAADQLNTILLAYLVTSACLAATATLCLAGIAIQTLFCYFSNGLIKALEPRWTGGIHLKAIVLTQNYSRKSIHKTASGLPLSAFRLLSRAVIIWELAALLAPFEPKPVLYIFLAAGILFHLTIALVMGLNTFFWSFVSAYPAILFLNKTVDELLK